jgi:hypothetical protein
MIANMKEVKKVRYITADSLGDYIQRNEIIIKRLMKMEDKNNVNTPY